MISNTVYFLYRVLCNCLSGLWREISQNDQFVDRSHSKTHFTDNTKQLLNRSWLNLVGR